MENFTFHCESIGRASGGSFQLKTPPVEFRAIVYSGPDGNPCRFSPGTFFPAEGARCHGIGGKNFSEDRLSGLSVLLRRRRIGGGGKGQGFYL